MRNSLNMYISEFRQDRQKQIKFALILAALAVVVAGVVAWQLHSTGLAMTNEVFCGQEEHIHNADCYDDGVLVCGIPEHTHTVECLMDETADVETSDEWEATLPQELTGNWSDDVAAVAVSQIGYTESENNFILAEDGETRQGYTRYGAWYGNDYGDWDAMFVSFCLNYAGVPEDEVPESSGAYALAVAYADLGLYADNGNIEPRQGDIVFLDADEDGQADSVGILTGVNDDTLTVVEGNLDDAVTETEYQADDVQIIGYGILPAQPGMENEGGSEEAGETVAVSGSAENDPEAAGSSSGTEDNQIKPLRDDDSVAFAVYSEDDSSLTFYADEEENVPVAGGTYGNKSVTEVYTGFDSPNYSDRYTASSPAPWYEYHNNIKIVYTDESFADVDLYYMNYWFNDFPNCTVINLTNINTGNVISLQGTFLECYALTEIVGIGDLDTHSVERLYSTFQNCESLTELPISDWDVSSCQSMDRTFYDCKLVETFELSNWKTLNVTDMAYIFQNCESATTIDVSDWDVTKVTDFTGAFRRCYKMTDIDLSGWVTSSATTMTNMFRQERVLETLNIENFDTANVIGYSDFLTESPALKEITVGDNFNLFVKSDTVLTDIQNWYDGKGDVLSDNYLIGVSGAGTYYTYMIGSTEQVVLNLGNGNGKYNNADYTHDRQAGTLLRYTTVSLAEYADSDGNVTINLPSDDDLNSTFTVVGATGDLGAVTVDLGSDLAYDYKLVGWVNVATGDYYDVSNGAAEAEVEVGGDTYNVFYADWIAATYDHGSQTDANLRDDIVSTSGFVTIHMYDYNDLFNLYSESLEQNNDEGVIWEAWTDSGNLYNSLPYGTGNRLTSSFIFVNNGTVGYSSTQGEQTTGGMLTWPNYKTSGNTWTGTGVAPRNATEIWGITSPYSAPMNMLFDPESSAVGVQYVGEADYLFWIDDNGYYTYNSKEAAATYNQSDQCFYVYNGTQSVTNTEFSCFLPYNTYGESLNAVNGTVNYFFGMDMEVNFYLPNATGSTAGNTVNGEDMVFNFSGDDDILIFVDDQLVLDMSGIHDEAFGSINFNDGTVTMGMSTDDDGNIIDGTTSDISLSAGTHDLKVYYMERGGYASNLEIQFNVVSVWDYESGEVQTVTADKTWVDSNGKVIEDPTTISDVYSSVEVGLFDALGPREEKTEDTDGVFGYTKDGTQYTVTYEDDSGISHTFVYDSSVPSLTYTEGDSTPVIYSETNSAGQVLDENGYVIAWLDDDTDTLHIRVDQQTLNSENDWHYAWELLDPDGEYEVQELSESSSYTTTSEKENLLRYEYWSIIGDSQIEYSFETGETLPVILTEAAQEASNSLGDTKDAMGWVIVATENGITTQQVEFSRIAELQELIDEDSGQTHYKTIAGVTSQSEIDKLGSGAIWYVVDAEGQIVDATGYTLEDFYLYCILDGTQYYLTLQEATDGYTLGVTSDPREAGIFCYDTLGELLVVLEDESTVRVEIQADGTITIDAAELEAAKDDIRIFTLQETETSGFTFTASNVFLPDFTLEKVSALDPEITLAGVKFTLQDEEGQYYESYDKDTDQVTWSSENKEITIDDDGTYIFHHLPDGTYTLTETEAVDGYNMLPSAVTITIENGKIADASWSSEVNGSTDASDYIKISENDGLTITVENHTSAVLPNAGGAGTTLFYIIGGVLAAGAAVVLIRRRRING